MEYRGKLYTVVHGIDGGLWKWSVADLEGFTKSGTARSRPAAIKAAEMAIDKALAPKKVRLVPRRR